MAVRRGVSADPQRQGRIYQIRRICDSAKIKKSTNVSPEVVVVVVVAAAAVVVVIAEGITPS